MSFEAHPLPVLLLPRNQPTCKEADSAVIPNLQIGTLRPRMGRDLIRVTKEAERLGKAGGSMVHPPKWGVLTSTHPAGAPQVEPWARITLCPTSAHPPASHDPLLQEKCRASLQGCPWHLDARIPNARGKEGRGLVSAQAWPEESRWPQQWPGEWILASAPTPASGLLTPPWSSLCSSAVV